MSRRLFIFPFVRPITLWEVKFRTNPIAFSVSLLVNLITIALLYWIYKQLRKEAVVQARIESGQIQSPPRLAFISGMVLVVVFAGAMLYMADSASGIKAVELAESEYGQQYNYYVSGIQWSNGHVSATLVAYNDHEVKQVKVEWEQ